MGIQSPHVSVKYNTGLTGITAPPPPAYPFNPHPYNTRACGAHRAKHARSVPSSTPGGSVERTDPACWPRRPGTCLQTRAAWSAHQAHRRLPDTRDVYATAVHHESQTSCVHGGKTVARGLVRRVRGNGALFCGHAIRVTRETRQCASVPFAHCWRTGQDPRARQRMACTQAGTESLTVQ